MEVSIDDSAIDAHADVAVESRAAVTPQSSRFLGRLPKPESDTAVRNPCRELSNRVFDASSADDQNAARQELLADIVQAAGIAFLPKASGGYVVQPTWDTYQKRLTPAQMLGAFKDALSHVYLNVQDKDMRVVHGQVWVSDTFADILLYHFSARDLHVRETDGIEARQLGARDPVYLVTQAHGPERHETFCKALNAALMQAAIGKTR